MSNLQDLIARLRLDTGPFKRGVGEAKGQAGGLASYMRGALLPVAGALAAAFSARALWSGIRQGATEIDAVAKSARALGGSIAGFRAFETAAGEAGVNAQNLRAEIQNLDRALASGRADAALRALGLNAAELGALDVDARLAAIADAVADLGLSSGQTAALLQTLGVENRDMALLLMGGGEALRAARKDVEEYGLALSSVDAGRIERANDQLGRLSIVGQYLRQTIAVELMPAFGDMAQAITDSMREGGLLRSVLDAIVGAVARVATHIGNLATIGIGFVQWVGQGARAAWDLTNGMFGIGQAIASIAGLLDAALFWAFDMVAGFADLIRGAGGFGEALVLLGQVAGEVWEGIKISASALVPALQSVWSRIQAGFLRMLGNLQARWAGFLRSIAGGLEGIPGMGNLRLRVNNAAITAQSEVYTLDGDADAKDLGADALGAIASGRVTAGMNRGREALARLKAVAAEGAKEATAAAAAVSSLSDAAATLGGAPTSDGGKAAGGGGTADAAARGVTKIADAAKDAQRATQRLGQTFESAFVGVVTRAKTLREAIADLAGELAKMAAQAAFKGLFGSLFSGAKGGGFLGKLFGGAFANGGVFATGQVVPFATGGVVASPTYFPMAAGLTGLMGEAGPEAIMPLARDSAGRLGVRAGAQGGGVLRVELSPELVGQVLQQANGFTVQAVQAGMAATRAAVPGVMRSYEQRGIAR